MRGLLAAIALVLLATTLRAQGGPAPQPDPAASTSESNNLTNQANNPVTPYFLEGFYTQYARARDIGLDCLADRALEVAETPLVAERRVQKADGGVEITTLDAVDRSRLTVGRRRSTKSRPPRQRPRWKTGSSSYGGINPQPRSGHHYAPSAAVVFARIVSNIKRLGGHEVGLRRARARFSPKSQDSRLP